MSVSLRVAPRLAYQVKHVIAASKACACGRAAPRLLSVNEVKHGTALNKAKDGTALNKAHVYVFACLRVCVRVSSWQTLVCSKLLLVSRLGRSSSWYRRTVRLVPACSREEHRDDELVVHLRD